MVQLDAGGGITEFFNEKKHERKSWKLCSSRVPRSEVLGTLPKFSLYYFLLLHHRLNFFKPDCEEATFVFRFSLVQYQKLRIKLFRQMIVSLWLSVVRNVVRKWRLLSIQS